MYLFAICIPSLGNNDFCLNYFCSHLPGKELDTINICKYVHTKFSHSIFLSAQEKADSIMKWLFTILIAT